MKMCKGDHRDDDYFTYKCLLYCQLWRHKAALQKMTLRQHLIFIMFFYQAPAFLSCVTVLKKKNKVQRSTRMLVACIFFFVIFNA